MKPLIFIVLCFFLTAVHCSGGGIQGYGGQPVTFESYCETYATMTCMVADQCKCLGGIGFDFCKMYQLAQCKEDVEDPVNRGVKLFHPVEGGKCLGEIYAVINDCSLEGASSPEACDNLLTGNQGEGESCDGDDECISGLDCFHEKCVTLPGEDQACLEGEGCASHLFCGQDKRCHGFRGENEDCSEGGWVCTGSLYCGKDQKCRKYRVSGEDCSEGGWVCDTGLYCDSRTTTCQPYLGEGQGCTHQGAICKDDLYCSMAAGKCLSYPVNGKDCEESEGRCTEGAYCDADSICRMKKKDGDSCESDKQCLSDECEDGKCMQEDENLCSLI